MPQPRPEYAAGNYYHIYNRGAHRVSIFRGEKDYLRALGLMKKYLRQFQLAIIAYVLMPNYYHFLIRQDGEKRAGYLPQYVFNSYSKYFNFRHEHSGTIFEGHYKVKLIQSEAHLLHLCRYIHGNPVKDGLVAEPPPLSFGHLPRGGECVSLGGILHKPELRAIIEISFSAIMNVPIDELLLVCEVQNDITYAKTPIY